MKICFPVQENNHLESKVFNHFGSAPLFMIFDSEIDNLEPLNNQDLNHTHGHCSPIKALGGSPVDAIIVGGIGAGAITKLNEMGIKVFKASAGTIKENMALFTANGLVEMSVNHACGGHNGKPCGLH